MDLSECDDLCSVVYVWVTADRFYVRPHFWLPRQTAEEYQKREAIPYLQWSEAGAINLIEENTISPEVKKRIAAHILATHKTTKIKAVCYDRYRADDAVAAMEGAGLTCVPIPQGYSLSPGCSELDAGLRNDPSSSRTTPSCAFVPRTSK